MSERKIKYWGVNAEAAFGATGAKGDLGELFVACYLKSKGYNVTLHSDRDKQVTGYDLTFQKPTDEILYGADVKNNLNLEGTFFVECEETGWLLNPRKTSKLIWHVNPETGWMCWYARSRMKRYIAEKGYIGKPIIPIGRFYRGLEWIERKRAEDY